MKDPGGVEGGYELTYSAILASFLLDEKLGRLGVCGCACCIVSLRPRYPALRSTQSQVRLGQADNRSDP
jgi:hypothetical protein